MKTIFVKDHRHTMYFFVMGRIICLCSIILQLACIGQDSVDCSALSRPERAVELVYPQGGESLMLGDYVTVSWKVDRRMTGAVVLSVSQNGSSGPWRSILSDYIPVPGDSGVFCMDTVWIPGSEYDQVGYVGSGTVLLRVTDATDNSRYDESGMITISR